MSLLASLSTEFWITTIIVVASPGIGVAYTLATALGQGGRASVKAALACTLGIVPHVLAAVTGLAAIMHASAVLFNAVKYAGVIYLLWMAWQILQEHGALSVSAHEAKRSTRRILVDGMTANLLNPKLSIFFVAFLPQFVEPQSTRPLVDMLVLSGAFMAATFIVFALYGLFAATVRDHVVSQPRIMAWMRRTFAAAFGALAARLAMTER